MKTAFAILIGLHGLIHLIGFLKAFGMGQFSMLSGSFSRLHGMIWLLAAILFLLALWYLYSSSKIWPWIGLAAVILSQMLIIMSWADAKYGTWVNLIFLLVIASAIAENRFDARVAYEVQELYKDGDSRLSPSTDPLPRNPLPPIVEKWIQNSGIEKLGDLSRIHLKQIGEMRTKPKGKWMPFSAEQWFNLKEPGFIWKTRVKMMGPVYLLGRDKLFSGKGSMDILLASLIPVVSEHDGPKINQGSMIRFLAETCWFPAAAREPYLSWESLGERSARATFRAEPKVTGVFTFNPKGEMVSFEARRYMGAGGKATMETWMVRNKSFAWFGQVKIPDRSEVYWITEEGEFHWLSLEITEINYD